VKRKLFLVHWNQAESLPLAEVLREQGWQVEVEAEDGQRACRRILDALPLAVVIYLTRFPSHGRETASYLRLRPAGATLPIFFEDGSDETQRKVRERVTDARFVTQGSLSEALAGLVKTD
jgi:DNA-binding response OmpR family regulator